MKPATNRRLRQLHHYLGVSFAPAIVFFAVSGMLQTLGFHEAKGGRGPPQPWIAWIASVHKDQALPRPPEPAKAEHRELRPDGPAKPQKSTLPLKTFVGIMSLALIASSLIGVAIALSNRSMRRVSLVLLALGMLLPLALLLG